MMTAVLALLLLAGVIAFLIAPARGGDMSAFRGNSFAHRGLHKNEGDAPENSLLAFERACRAGMGMELDVRYSKDGVIVVFHDDSLKRMCGIDRPVRDFTAAELAEIRLAGSDQGIPTFDQVLELVAGRVPLIVEIKTGPGVKKLARETVERLKAYEGVYCIESFNPLALGEARKAAPEVLRGQLVASAASLKPGAGAAAPLLAALMLNVVSRPHFIARDVEAEPHLFWRLVEKMGADTALWTLHTQAEAAKARENDIRIVELWKES